jgi:hypothetical protein
LGDWHISHPGSPLRIAIASGVLHDVDKGSFALAGVELSLSCDGPKMEAVEAVNPGLLSELQQGGLLDAVVTTLNASGLLFRVVANGLLFLFDSQRATLVSEGSFQIREAKSIQDCLLATASCFHGDDVRIGFGPIRFCNEHDVERMRVSDRRQHPGRKRQTYQRPTRGSSR